MDKWKEKTISPTREQWESVISSLRRDFCQDLYACFYSKDEMTKLQWAFSEAIYNKVKHGNNFDPKKKTSVKWMVTPNLVQVKIKDEGEVFDFKKALKDAEKKKEKFASVALLDEWNPQLCGAGLAITLRNLGRKSISYDEGGREVSLNYKKPRKPPQEVEVED
jgi:anti-sigma regulatory factor (Ser/Thr protein kinase)